MSPPPVLDPRERFLREIADRIRTERIAEIHLFPPLRSGGRESGVAVIAAFADLGYSQGELPPPVGEPVNVEGHAAASAEPDAPGPPPDVESTTTPADLSHHSPAADTDPTPPKRLVIYRAVYRWTRKGPDRGRWEVDVTAEADAPLHAVSDVVRGVQRRAGEDGEPELITPDALRVALSDRPWAAAM
jgi:hypothetical protein